MNNAPAPQKARFSVAITTPQYQQLISNTLQDPKRRQRFIANITSAVAVNKTLQECTSPSIISGALLGESLNLTPSPQLGQFYLVPYKNKGVMEAQFQIGYKGLIQLAIRSGYYKSINCLEVKEGEFHGYNPFTEELNVTPITDPATRAAAPTIGYYAAFEYLNGFRKAIYWTREQVLAHADRYSKAFSAEAYKKLQRGEIPESELWKYSSFWYKDFDSMAKKTMLRQLISHWGAMSTDLSTAITLDETAIRNDGEKLDLSEAYEEEEEQQEPKQEVPVEVVTQEPPQTVNMADL